MVPFGGVGVMLLGAALALVPCVLLYVAVRRERGPVVATAWAGLAWSLVVVALVTLVPAQGAPGIVSAESRLGTCGELGGPAPDGFWIFTSGQGLLNTALFVPSGAFLAIAALARPRLAVLTLPLGLGLLALYSGGIEYTQLVLARIDRACDLTDLVDNVTGAVIGALVGILLALGLRPWRRRA